MIFHMWRNRSGRWNDGELVAVRFLILCVFVSLRATGALSPKNAPQYEDLHPGAAIYYRVVDRLFPRKPLGATPCLILLTLRYMPAFERESQVVISKTLDGGYAVSYYSLPSGSERIGERISRIMQELKVEDPPAIAERIKVCVRNVDVPSGVMHDLMRRYAKLRLSPDLGLDPTTIILDGTTYELWFQIVGSGDKFHISFAGDDYGHDAKAHPLVRWMNEVKRVVEKYAAAQQ